MSDNAHLDDARLADIRLYIARERAKSNPTEELDDLLAEVDRLNERFGVIGEADAHGVDHYWALKFLDSHQRPPTTEEMEQAAPIYLSATKEVDRLRETVAAADTERDWAQARLAELTDATDDALRTRLAVAIDRNDRAAILEVVGALSRRLTAVTEERDNPRKALLRHVFNWGEDDGENRGVEDLREAILDAYGAGFGWSYRGEAYGKTNDPKDDIDFETWYRTATEERSFTWYPQGSVDALKTELAALRASYTWTPATPDTMPPVGSGPWLVKYGESILLCWVEMNKDKVFWTSDRPERRKYSRQFFIPSGTFFAALPLEPDASTRGEAGATADATEVKDA